MGVAVIAASMTLFACGGSASDGDGDGETIKIAAVLSLTGAGSGLGTPVKAGIEMAVDEINKGGGIDGRKIETLLKDDASNPETAAAAADELINGDGAVALLGGNLTANTDAMAARTGAGKTPQIAFTGLGPPVELDYENLYHVLPPQVENARAMLEYAVKEVNAKKIGVLHDSGYGKVVMTELEKLADEYGVEYVAVEEGDVAATDVTTQAAKVNAAKPEAVFVVSTNAVFFRNAKETGVSVPVISAIGAATYEYAKAMGEAGNGLIFAEFVVGEDPLDGQKDFVEAYQAKYDALPKNFEAAGYDAVYMLKRALEAAGVDASSDDIGKALREPHEGAMGSYNFGADDKTGIEVDNYVYSQLEEGVFNRLEFRP